MKYSNPKIAEIMSEVDSLWLEYKKTNRLMLGIRLRMQKKARKLLREAEAVCGYKHKPHLTQVICTIRKKLKRESERKTQ